MASLALLYCRAVPLHLAWTYSQNEMNWFFDKYFIVRNPVVPFFYIDKWNPPIFLFFNLCFSLRFSYQGMRFLYVFFFFLTFTKRNILWKLLFFVWKVFWPKELKIHNGFWWFSISLLSYNQYLIKHSTQKITVSAGVIIVLVFKEKHWYQSL